MDRIDELLLLEADEFDFFETEIIRNESIDKADMQHLQIRLFRCCAVKEHEERFKALIRRESIDKVTMQFNARIRTAEQMETAWRKNDSYKKLKERLKADEAKKRAASLVRPFNVEEQRSIEDANIHGCINNNNNNNNNTGIQSISSDDNSTLSDGPLPLPTTSTSVTKRSRRRRNRGRGKKNGIYSTPAASVKKKNPALYGGTVVNADTKNSNTPTTTTTTQHTNVHKNDVLYGNGNTIVAHDGNFRLFMIIKNIKPKYINDLSQVEWNEIAIGIYNKVTSDSDDELDDSQLAGRFLKLKSSNGIYSLWDTMDEQKPLNSAWEIMSTQDAIEMIVRDMFWAIMSEQKRDERCKQLLRLQPKYIELFDSQDDTTNDQRNSINMNVTTTPNNAATVDDGITKGRLDEIPTTNTVQENMNALSVPNMKWKQIASYPDKKRSIYLFTSDDVDDEEEESHRADNYNNTGGNNNENNSSTTDGAISGTAHTTNINNGEQNDLDGEDRRNNSINGDDTTRDTAALLTSAKLAPAASAASAASLAPAATESESDDAPPLIIEDDKYRGISTTNNSGGTSIRNHQRRSHRSSESTTAVTTADTTTKRSTTTTTTTKSNSALNLLHRESIGGGSPSSSEAPYSPGDTIRATPAELIINTEQEEEEHVHNRVVNNGPQMKPPPFIDHDGMRIKSYEIQNDGHCAATAIGYGTMLHGSSNRLFMTQDPPLTAVCWLVRETIANEMLANQDEYKGFIENDTNRSFYEYVNHIRTSDLWLGPAEFKAYTNATGIAMLVIGYDDKYTIEQNKQDTNVNATFDPSNGSGPMDKKLILLYNKINHYSLGIIQKEVNKKECVTTPLHGDQQLRSSPSSSSSSFTTELEKVHQKSMKKAHDGTTSNKEKITKIQKEMDSKVEQISLVLDQNGSSDDAAKRTTFVPGEQGSPSAATSSSSSSGVIRENTLRVSSPSNQVEKKGNSSSDDTSSDSDCSCGDGGIGSTSTKKITTSLIGTAPAQDEFKELEEVIDLTNPFQKRFSRAPNRFDPSEKPKTTKPKTIDKKRHNTRYILRCLTQPNLNLMVENYAEGYIKCPLCSDIITVASTGCKVIRCSNHRPNWYYFCYHCKAECVGGNPSCLCSHSNGDKARRIEQEKETCWGFKKYH